MGNEANRRDKSGRPRIRRIDDNPPLRYEDLSYEKRRRIYNAVKIVMDHFEERARKERDEAGEKDLEESAPEQPGVPGKGRRNRVDEDEGREPENVVEVARLERTCLAVPSQWEGETAGGKFVYIRYRWGTLRVDVAEETTYEEVIGDCLAEYIEYPDLKSHLAGVLALPEQEAYAEDWEANWGPLLRG